MYHGMMLTLCSTKVTSEHLLSANLTTREYVFVPPNAKNESRKINSVYSRLGGGLELDKRLTITTLALELVMNSNANSNHSIIQNNPGVRTSYYMYQNMLCRICSGYNVYINLNPLKTSPEYTRAGVYGKCVLWQNQIIFNGLILVYYPARISFHIPLRVIKVH